MIYTIIHSLLKRRHFWRYASFDEVAELYASRMMRLLAQFMINMFVALFLYQNGYSLLFIAVYYALCFALRALVAYPSARMVAKFGPKHTILVANLLYIPALVGFSFVSTFGLVAIVIYGVFQSISMVMYDLAYMVDFSKVKHVTHAGKEIGYMKILERLTASLSPLIGGFIAFMFAPEATMWLSAILFATASIPLLRTKEPVRVNQKLDVHRFPWKDTWHSIVSETAIGYDMVASNFVWVLFIALVVFGSTSNDIYFTIGAFASVTALTAFISAYSFGRIIDWNHGGDLLKIATVANSATHLFRAFVTTPAGVFATNVTNEVATSGYGMAYMRGIFDTADRATGHRILYLCFVSISMNLGAMLASVVFAVLLLVCSTTTLAFQLFFVTTAFYVLLAMTARFRMYR